MHVWGQFGVIVGPRADIEASTELGAKSLLIPTALVLHAVMRVAQLSELTLPVLFSDQENCLKWRNSERDNSKGDTNPQPTDQPQEQSTN